MKFVQHKTITLASGSPRRKEYLEKYQLYFSVVTANVDETALPGEKPQVYARRMAEEKAMAVVPLCDSSSVIIAADTIVVLDEEILGKPVSRQAVYPMLVELNGKRHEVITAYQIRDPSQDNCLCRSVSTQVQFNRLEESLLNAYAQTDEPLDKAGAYSIQGLGTILVKSIDGSYNNVVGLPIEQLLLDLIDMNVISVKGKT